MATVAKPNTSKDFNLLFFSAETPLNVLYAALRKKWDWVVPSQKENAFWYCVLINNLQQTTQLPTAVTMGHVRQIISKGIKRSAFDRLKQLTQVSNKDLVEVVRIPLRTLSRRTVFQPDESERIIRVASAFQRAIDVFEDLQKARSWFSTPKKALGEKSPLRFCDTEIGAREVVHLLGRIEQGVFS